MGHSEPHVNLTTPGAKKKKPAVVFFVDRLGIPSYIIPR
jgi:hypothetical protein